MAQSRKKAIMQGVERQRRRNRAISFAAIALVVVVILTVVFYPRAGNAVPLPSYLDECVQGVPTYHYHPGLTIVISGTTFPIPPDVGRQGSCFRPLHTHPSNTNGAVWDGSVHVETNEDRQYKLGDFFLIWGNFKNDPTFAIFNSTQIFTNHIGPGHTLNMTVNGQQNSQFQNLVFPKDAQPNTSTAFSVVITYT